MAAVDRCLEALASAATDRDRRIDALLIVEDVVRKEFDAGDGPALRRVFDAMDQNVLVDALSPSSSSIEVKCHGRHAALSLLAAFATDADLVDSDSLLALLPFVVEHLTDACNGSRNTDAVMFVCAVSLTVKGQRAIVDAKLLGRLCCAFELEVDSDNGVFDVGPSVLDAIVSVLGGGNAGRCPCSLDCFHGLMNALARWYAATDKASNLRYDRCSSVSAILYGMPKDTSAAACADQPWYAGFHDELMGTLCFRLTEAQREPLLQLCAAFVDRFDVTWALGDNSERSYRLFLLLVQLACVEMRMALEDQTLEEAIVKGELLAACFLIVERAVQFLVSEERHAVTFAARHQLYEAITSAMAAVLHFITESSSQLESIVSVGPEDIGGRWYFVCAILRVAAGWLAEETSALRPEVYSILPLLIRMCQTDGSLRGHEPADSLLYFLLPAFVHLSVEDESREIMLAQALPATITDYVESLVPVVCSSDAATAAATGENGHQGLREEGAFALCCGTLINIVVLEDGQRVGRDPAFLRLLKLVFAALPAIDKRAHQLVIRGNLAVLGLLLLRRSIAKCAANESSIYRFLSASIRFLWDAFVIDEDFSAHDAGRCPRLALSRPYRDVWDDLKELWFLGMQSLSGLLPTVPWIGLFVVESGWTETLVTALARVGSDGVEDGVCREYEGFLVCLTRCCGRARAVLLELGATRMCHTLGMTDLERVLRGTVI